MPLPSLQRLAVSSGPARHAEPARIPAGQKLHYNSRCGTTILGSREWTGTILPVRPSQHVGHIRLRVPEPTPERPPYAPASAQPAPSRRTDPGPAPPRCAHSNPPRRRASASARPGWPAFLPHRPPHPPRFSVSEVKGCLNTGASGARSRSRPGRAACAEPAVGLEGSALLGPPLRCDVRHTNPFLCFREYAGPCICIRLENRESTPESA